MADRAQLRVVDVHALPPRDRRLRARPRRTASAQPGAARRCDPQRRRSGLFSAEGEAKPREPHTLLFTGNYEYAPNVDAALRLATRYFPAIRAQRSDAKLWIVGNAPPPELQALASDCDHRHRARPGYADVSRAGGGLRLPAAARRGHQEQSAGGAGAVPAGRRHAAERRWHRRAGWATRC